MDIGTPERYLQASWDILEGAGRDAGRADRAEGMLVDPGREVADGRDDRAAGRDRARLPGRRRGARSATRSCSTAARSARAPRSTGSILAAGVEVAAGAGLEGAVVGAR